MSLIRVKEAKGRPGSKKEPKPFQGSRNAHEWVYVVSNENMVLSDVKDLLGEDCKINWIGKQWDMYDVFVHCGVFPSRSQAKANWFGSKSIPLGYYEHTVGSHKIYTYCPMSEEQLAEQEQRWTKEKGDYSFDAVRKPTTL